MGVDLNQFINLQLNQFHFGNPQPNPFDIANPHFGLRPPQPNFDWNAWMQNAPQYKFQETGSNPYSSYFESDFNRIWTQIKDHKPSTTEKVAFGVFTAFATTKIADDIIHRIKLRNYQDREQQAAETINQAHWDSGNVFDNIKQFMSLKSRQVDEYFRCDGADPRSKALFLSSEFDRTDALHPNFVSDILKNLDDKFDLKFALVRSYEDICKEIKEVASQGKLAYVILEGHGSSSGDYIYLSEFEGGFKILDENELKKNPSCFSGLDPLGKILLASCCAGSSDTGCGQRTLTRMPGTDNIAQMLANYESRSVSASTEILYPTEISVKSADPLTFSHPSSVDAEKNVFQEFYPKIPEGDVSCRNLDWSALHPREINAMDAIEGIVARNSQVTDSYKFAQTQEYLRLCKSDERPKILYLSALSLENDLFKPTQFAEFLTGLNQKFDAKFKIVRSLQDVCEEIRNAVQLGNVLAAVVHAKGNENSVILDKSPRLSLLADELIGGHEDLLTCFSALPSNAIIVLAAESTGSSQKGVQNQNIAQRMASKVGRAVFAPAGRFDISKLDIFDSYPWIVSSHVGNNADETALQQFIPNEFSKLADNRNCISIGCSDLELNRIHPKELLGIDAVVNTWWNIFGKPLFKTTQEFLRLSKNDLKQKFLYFVGEKNDEFLSLKGDPYNLANLDKEFDLKYKLIDSWKDICRQVDEASEIGEVANVYISASADSGKVIFSDRPDGQIVSPDIFSSCFKGLLPDGRIILEVRPIRGLEAGESTKLAQEIANVTGKTVLIPSISTDAEDIGIASIRPFMPFHKTKNEDKALFNEFSPKVNT